MTTEELNILRQKLLNRDNTPLDEFFIAYQKDCHKVLMSQKLCQEDETTDILIEALIVLRKNIISGKVEKITSIKSYLTAICINMAKKVNQQKLRTQKKVDDVRLLFYTNNDIGVEEQENKDALIELSMKALHSITEGCQKIIMAYYVYNLSMKEIAEEFGLSSSDVAKTKKSRCYKSLMAAVSKLRKVQI